MGTRQPAPGSNRKVQTRRARKFYHQQNVVARMFCPFNDWRHLTISVDRNTRTFVAIVAFVPLMSPAQIPDSADF